MFKNVKNGDIVYLISIDAKTEMPEYKACTISLVSELHPKPFSVTNIDFSSSMEMDITIDVPDEESKFIQGVNPDNDYIIAGKYRIADTKERINAEIKKIYDDKMRHINNVDHYKEIADKCESIMQDIGFTRVKTDTDERIDCIEKGMKNLQDMLSKFLANYEEQKVE